MSTAVLIVDDEAGFRELLARWLGTAQYTALEASSAEEGLEILAQSPHVKLVIADLEMPGKGGAWLVDEMRQHFPTTAVVLATVDDQVPGTLSLQPGVVGYLVKPLTRDAVLRLVATGVRRSSEFAEQARIRRATDPIEELGQRGHGGDAA